MILKITLLNIKKFIIYHPLLFVLLIFAQIVCCIEVFISCGMAYNMNYVEKVIYETDYFAFAFDLPDDLEWNIIKRPDGTEDVSFIVRVDGKSVDEYYINGALSLDEGKKKIEEFISGTSDYKIDYIETWLYEGNPMKLKEIHDLEYTSFHPDFNCPEQLKNYLKSNQNIFLSDAYDDVGNHMRLSKFYRNQSYDFFGKKYKYVGEYDKPYTFIPYKVIPEEFVIGAIFVHFEDKLGAQDIDKINLVIDSIFGDEFSSREQPVPYDADKVRLSTMLLVISCVVMLVIILAISKFYSFIFDTRKQTLAIMRLCGCSREAVNMIYSAEVFLTMLFTTIVGFIIFRYTLFEPISKMYPSFEVFFTNDIYMLIIAAYLILSFIILSVTVRISTKKSVKEMIK